MKFSHLNSSCKFTFFDSKFVVVARRKSAAVREPHEGCVVIAAVRESHEGCVVIAAVREPHEGCVVIAAVRESHEGCVVSERIT